MEFFSAARKKAEELVEKSLTGVSDAIYATGDVVGRGGSIVTHLLTTSADAVGEFGGDIYSQCCNLVGAATSTKKVQEALEANEWVDDRDVASIL